MSFVDLMGDARWSREQVQARVDEQTRRDVVHSREHTMFRRLLQLLLPLAAQGLPAAPADGSQDAYAATRAFLALALPHCVPLTLEQATELGQAAAAFTQADVIAAQAYADAQRVNARLDYEEVRAALALLPSPAPTDGSEDPLQPDERATAEQRRADLQARLDAATQDTLDLVAQHDALLASRNTPEAPA